MRIEILDVTTTEAAQSVQSGKADIADRVHRDPETAALDVQILLRDQFVAVMADTHPLARRRSVTWRVLAEEPFIAMSAGSSVRQLTDLAMAQADVSPTTVVEARNIATAGGIIAAGLGVSAFPELVLPLMSSTNIETRTLTGPTTYRDIAVITPADTALSPPAQRFVERLPRQLLLTSCIRTLRRARTVPVRCASSRRCRTTRSRRRSTGHSHRTRRARQ